MNQLGDLFYKENTSLILEKVAICYFAVFIYANKLDNFSILVKEILLGMV
jgi:hypothetical protein